LESAQESSGVSSAAVDISIHGTGVPPLRLFAPPGILAKGRRKAELDEEPELSELKVVESEDVVAGATASGEATSGGLSTFFRRNDLCTSVISAVSAGSVVEGWRTSLICSNQLLQEIQALSFVVDLKP
jgi:hypothetical protein